MRIWYLNRRKELINDIDELIESKVKGLQTNLSSIGIDHDSTSYTLKKIFERYKSTNLNKVV